MAAVLDTARSAVAVPNNTTTATARADDELPFATALIELTDRYEHAAEHDEWGEKLDVFLRRAVTAQSGQ